MKKIILLGLPLAAFFLNSCNNEDIVDGRYSSEGNTTIVASFEGNVPSGRTSVSEDYKILWSQTDALGVYCADATTKFSPFTYQSGAGTTTAEFTGNLETDKIPSFVIFPYQEDMSVTDNTLTMKLPSSFSYTKDSNGPMYAKVVENNLSKLSFFHMAPLIKLTINKIPAGATTFVLTASEYIAGNCEATVTDERPILKVKNDEKACKKITVTFEAGSTETSHEFYIPLPANTYASITAELTDGNSKLYFTKTLENRTLKRNNILVVPPLDCLTITGTTTVAINQALSGQLPTEAPAQPVTTDVALTSKISTDNNTDAIEIPVVKNSNVNLAFASAPATNTYPVTIKATTEGSGGTTPTESVNKISVSVPEVQSLETAPSFTIEMPVTTVELGAVGETATYNKVVATTAINTLVVRAGVTVKELEVAGGNVEIYGTVENLAIQDGNSSTTKVTVTGLGVCRKYVNNGSKDIAYKNEWDGVSRRKPALEDRNGSKVYQVYSAAELAYFQLQEAPYSANNKVLETKTTIATKAVLNNDIDLNNKPWIGMVLGEGVEFDGNGKTISNIYMNEHTLNEGGRYSPEACAGLFAITKTGSTIKNVTIHTFKADNGGADAKWVGALIGYAYNTNITGCKVEDMTVASESANSYRMGGLVGLLTGNVAVTVTNCEAKTVNIKGAYSLGGLIGTVQGAGGRTFSGCSVSGITLSVNANSAALKGAWASATTFYGPKDFVGNMSKFIGDIGANCSVTFASCTVSENEKFTKDELASFGYDDTASYTYQKGLSEENITKIVEQANHYSLADATTPLIPAQVSNGVTIKVGESTLVAGTDYNRFTLIRASGSLIDKYQPTDGTWAD